jgi:hypothetical protein
MCQKIVLASIKDILKNRGVNLHQMTAKVEAAFTQVCKMGRENNGEWIAALTQKVKQKEDHCHRDG